MALTAALAAAGVAYSAHVWQLGHDAAVAERSARNLAAVVGRVQDNATLALTQDAINITITETKHEELLLSASVLLLSACASAPQSVDLPPPKPKMPAAATAPIPPAGWFEKTLTEIIER